MKEIIIMMIMTVMIIGCGNETKDNLTAEERAKHDEYLNKKQAEYEAQKVEQQNTKDITYKEDATLSLQAKQEVQISAKAGLGTTKEIWDKTYNKSVAGNYANDKYIVMYDNEGKRAIHVTIQNVNKEQLGNNVRLIVPVDTQVIKQDEKGSDKMLLNKHFECESEKLKGIYPSSEGKFEVITTIDRQSGEWIMSVVSIMK